MNMESRFRVKVHKRFVKVTPEELATCIKILYTPKERLRFLLQLSMENIIDWDSFSCAAWDNDNEIDEYWYSEDDLSDCE